MSKSVSITFDLINGIKTFSLPVNVTSIQIESIGGGGGGGNGYLGGNGALVNAFYSNLIPGSIYTINVGGGGIGGGSSAGGGGLTEVFGNGIYIIAGGGGGGTPNGRGGDASGNIGGNGTGNGGNFGYGGNNGIGGLGSFSNPVFSDMNGTGGNGGNVDFSGNDCVGQNGAGGGSGSYDLSGGKCYDQSNISQGGIGGGGQAVSNGSGGGGGAGYGGGGGGGGTNGSFNGGGGGGGSIATGAKLSSVTYSSSTNGGQSLKSGGDGSVIITYNIYSSSHYNDNIYIVDYPHLFEKPLPIPPSTFFIIPKDYTFHISNNSIIENEGAIINYGTINIDSGSAINNTSESVFLNEFSGTINNNSTMNSNINSGRFINRGIYNNQSVGSIFTNNIGGAFKNKNGGSFNNNGFLFNLPGGIFENNYNYLTNSSSGQVINYAQYIPNIQGPVVSPSYNIIVDGSGHSLAINNDDGYLYAWGANESGQLGNNSNIPSSVPIKVVPGKETIIPPQYRLSNNKQIYTYDFSTNNILYSDWTFSVSDSNQINDISVNSLQLTFSQDGYWDVSGVTLTIYGVNNDISYNEIFQGGSVRTFYISNIAYQSGNLVITLLESPGINFVNNGNDGNYTITLVSPLSNYTGNNFLSGKNPINPMQNNVSPYYLQLDSSFNVPVPHPQNYTLPSYNNVTTLTNIITGSNNGKTITSTTSFNLNQLYNYNITTPSPSNSTIILSGTNVITTLTFDGGLKYYLALQITNSTPTINQFAYFNGSYIKSSSNITGLNTNTKIYDTDIILIDEPFIQYLIFDCSNVITQQTVIDISNNPNVGYIISGISHSSLNLNLLTNDISSNTLGNNPTITLTNNAGLSFTSPSQLPILSNTSNTLTLDMSVNLTPINKTYYDGSFNTIFSYNLSFQNTYSPPLNGNKWISIAAGGNTSFGLRDDGSIYSWGSNTSGHLGLGIPDTSRNYPSLVSSSKFINVACGFFHTLIVDSNHNLVSTGDNTYGQLGKYSILTFPSNSTDSYIIPELITSVNIQLAASNGANVTINNYPVSHNDEIIFRIDQIPGGVRGEGGANGSSGGYQGNDGSPGYPGSAGSYVYRNNYNIGDGLIAVAGGNGGASYMYSGGYAGSSGTYWIGNNGLGGSGGGDGQGGQTSGNGYNFVNGGNGGSGGQGNHGSVTFTWKFLDTDRPTGGDGGGGGGGGYGGGGGGGGGRNGFGPNGSAGSAGNIESAGNGTAGGGNSYGGGGGAGGSYMYTTQNGNTIRTGNGTISSIALNHTDFLYDDVACGAYHSFGITTSGVLIAWGRNDSGQLGINNGTNYTSTLPTPVDTSYLSSTSTKWIKIVGGYQHSMGLRDDGTLYAWGDCFYGQLGINQSGANINSNFPQLVWNANLVGTKWIQIASGWNHSIGLRDSGDLYGWGDNTFHQLTNSINYDTLYKVPAIINPPSPPSGTKWISCSAGAYYSMGVRDDGNVYTWGLNTSGQLGLGLVSTYVEVPTLITDGTLNPILASSSNNNNNYLNRDFIYRHFIYRDFNNNNNDPLLSIATSPNDDDIYILNLNQQITSSLSIPANKSLIIPKDNTMTINPYYILDICGAIINYGTINIDSSASIYNTNTGTFVNEFGGTITNDSRSNLNINSSKIINRGVYTNNLDAILTNIVGAVFLNKNGGVFNNYGTFINLPGGIFENNYNYLNNYGQILNYGQYIPDVQLSQYPSYYLIAVGESHSLAINTTDGEIYAWGANELGQLGNNTNTQSNSPLMVNHGKSIQHPNINNLSSNSNSSIYTNSTHINLYNDISFGFPSYTNVANIFVNSLTLTFSQYGYWDVNGNIVTIYGILNTDFDYTIFNNGSLTSTLFTNTLHNITTINITNSNLIITLNSAPSPSNYVNNENNGNNNIILYSPIPYSAVNFLNGKTPISMQNTSSPYYLTLDSSFNVPVHQPQNYILLPYNNQTTLTNIITGSSNIKTITSTTSFNTNQLYNYKIISKPSSNSSITLSGTNVMTTLTINEKYFLALQISNTTYTPNQFNYFIGSYITSTNGTPLNNIKIIDVFVEDFSPNPDYLCFDCSFSEKPNLTGVTNYSITGISDSSLNLNSSANVIHTNNSGTSPTITLTSISFTSPSQLPILNNTSNTLTLDMSVNLIPLNTTSFDGSFNTNFSYNLSFNQYIENDLSGTKWTTIAGGSNTSIGLRNDGSLYSWGDNTSGHLGISSGTDASRNYPTIIPPSANWIGVVSGLNHALALDYNNFLWSWGHNTYGQLGINSNDNKNSPNLTHNSTTVSDFACGANHTLAIHLADGSLHSCGNNDKGQLGTGSTTDTSKNTFQNISMVNVNTGTKWIKVAAGFQHSMGLRDDGTLYAWGDCSYGQLGIGVAGADISFNTPQLVLLSSYYGIVTGKKWTQIACGNYHSIGLRDDGTLWAWGRGSEGQIGYSGTSNFNKPFPVIDTNYISCSAGAYHTMGVRNDGKVYTWGLNTNGQLGLGNTTSPILSPTEVSGTLLNPIINI